MDPSVVQQPSDVMIRLVILNQVEDEVKHELSAHRLISMHVGHIFNVWFSNHMLIRRSGDHHDPHLPTLNTFPDGVESGEVGIDGAAKRLREIMRSVFQLNGVKFFIT